MKPLRPLGWLAAGLMLALTMGCQQGPARTKVAFVTNNPETFWNIAEKGCAKGEKEFGVEVVFRKPDSGDASRQIEILDNLLNQDIKALAVSVINPAGQNAHLKEIAAKMPLITQDNDAPDSGRLCYIGTNNYKAGRAVGQLIKEVLPDGGVLAVFVGQTEPLNARQRRQGMLDELAGKPEPKDINDIEYGPDGQMYGKYRLHRTYTDQPRGSQQATENASDALTDLAGEKNLCFIGLWAYNPPAILTAVKDKDKLGQVKIIGLDENDATLQGIIDGHIYGTVVQNPFEFGYQAVRMMASLAKGDRSVLPKDGILYVPHRIITKDGGKDRIPAATFQKELNELLGK
ncbi:MAG TPA: sugar-binding protein [Gemmataceae bacterium]|nr:sugar-binding protein [Gemmataceae bacterium]